MNCVICKQGQTQAGLVTVTFEREGAIMVFKRVPADVCENCGDYYLNDNVTGKLLEWAEETIAKPRSQYFTHPDFTDAAAAWTLLRLIFVVE